MSRRGFILLLVALAATAAFALSTLLRRIPARTPSRTFAITHITVIDCAGAAPRTDVTVLIADGRIAAIGQDIPVPLDAGVINASGKFLIPGLWDMHAHCEYEGKPERFLNLHVAHGVTGIRDMGGVLTTLVNWRREIEQGKRLGPRMIISGETIDGPIDKGMPHANRLRLFASNAAEGRAHVRRLKERGADGIKVYSGLGGEAYFAIADEAKRVGLPSWGHVPEVVRVVEASDAGQRSLEHILDLMRACSTQEEQMKEEARAVVPQGFDAAMLVLYDQFHRAPRTYSEEKAGSLFAYLRKNGTWVCPTLVANQSGTENGPLKDAASIRFLSPARRDGANRQRATKSPEDLATFDAIMRRALPMVGQMQRSGVGLLAGTDLPAGIPGKCLHDELALLVAAGLSPSEALQTATINPARFLGMEQELGTVEVGKVADLVVLKSDPLADIQNSTTIEAVVRNGVFLNRAKLDALLAEAEAASME